MEVMPSMVRLISGGAAGWNVKDDDARDDICNIVRERSMGPVWRCSRREHGEEKRSVRSC